MRDYLNEMLYALTSAYSHTDYNNRRRGFPVETNIGRLFSIFAWGLGLVHEQADLIKLWDNLDYACGSVLDRYGTNFGVKRFGANDVFYRLAIKVKVLSQLSGGDIDTVLNAAASLFEIPAEKIVLTELFPAKIRLDIRESDLSPETLSIMDEIAAMIKRILAAGVGIHIRAKSEFHIKQKIFVGSCLGLHNTLTIRPRPSCRNMRQKLFTGTSLVLHEEMQIHPSKQQPRNIKLSLGFGQRLVVHETVTVRPRGKEMVTVGI